MLALGYFLSVNLCASGTVVIPNFLVATPNHEWQCQSQTGGNTASCSAPKPGNGNASSGGTPYIGTTVPSTGTGQAGSASFTTQNGGATCGFDLANTGFVAPTVSSTSNAMSFPKGWFKLRLVNCAAGSTVRVSIQWPVDVSTMNYQKYGKTPTSTNSKIYYTPINLVKTGNTVSFDITDGGLGDDDLTANGVIEDPSGPVAFDNSVPMPVPSLGAKGALGLLLLLIGLGCIRARLRGN